MTLLNPPRLPAALGGLGDLERLILQNSKQPVRSKKEQEKSSKKQPNAHSVLTVRSPAFEPLLPTRNLTQRDHVGYCRRTNTYRNEMHVFLW